MAIGMQSVFECANVVAREQIYQVANYSISGGDTRSSLVVSVTTQPVDAQTDADTWMISGVVGRIFVSETGESPAKAIEKIRLEAARIMVERGRHSLEAIARETGFRDRSHLREVFVRGYGVTPQSLRRDAREPVAD